MKGTLFSADLVQNSSEILKGQISGRVIVNVNK